MRLDLISHGVCETTAFLCGARCDPPLSAQGRRQMQRRLRQRHYDLILSSPLQRCQHFTAEWAGIRGIPWRVYPLLKERDWGLWDGLPQETIEQRWPGALDTYLQAPFRHTPPEAESLSDFRQRIRRALQYGAAQPVNRLLMVTHPGVLKMAAQIVLDFPDAGLLHFGVEYGGYLGLEIIGEFIRLEQLEND